jgi:hypothetical protein
MDSKQEISMHAQDMYGLLNELTDILNVPLFTEDLLRMTVNYVAQTWFKTEREKKIFVTLFKIYSSYDFYKDKNTIDSKYFKYTPAMIHVLYIIYGNLTPEKIREHYSEIIEYQQTKVEAKEVSEGAYLGRCNNIKTIVEIMIKLNRLGNNGYQVVKTVTYTESDDETNHLIMLTLEKTK